jgi:hypothetical protein
MRIEKLWPQTGWDTVWKNLWEAPVQKHVTTTWYKVIQDNVPTKGRLYKIRIASNDTCRECGRTDTLRHRLLECGQGRHQRDWTKQKMAIILRMDPRWIPDEWLVRPQYKLWPAQRRRAIGWMLATFVTCRMRKEGKSPVKEYDEFIRRSLNLLQRSKARQRLVGNYLNIL